MDKPRRPLTPWKRAKYSMLRHLPGWRGLHYARKLRLADLGAVNEAFRAAVEGAGGKVCVDLGANMGVHARAMAAHAAKVYAFEPDPWTAARLRENLSDLENVEVVEAAAGVRDGAIQLYRSPEFGDDPDRASQSASVLSEKRNVDASAPLEVQEVDFARWLGDLDAEVAVVKIDIEGAEVALLERLFDAPAFARVGHVFVETHESRLPHLAARTEALRARAAGMTRPVVNMDWK